MTINFKLNPGELYQLPGEANAFERLADGRLAKIKSIPQAAIVMYLGEDLGPGGLYRSNPRALILFNEMKYSIDPDFLETKIS